MRTNIVIDDALLNEAFQVSAARTKKELIHEALKTLITVKRRKDLTELSGKIQLHSNFNHTTLRKMREG